MHSKADANFYSSKGMSAANGNVIDPAFVSKSGAYNGTGLAIASYSFGTGGYGVINVYFQHWSGQLRKMQLMSDGSWQGGDSTNIVATDARNATPISAVAYAMDHVSTVNIPKATLNHAITNPVSGIYFTLTNRTLSAKRFRTMSPTSGEMGRSAT
jgi:hypothetical protein